MRQETRMPKCPKDCNKPNCVFFKKAEIPAVVANDDITPPQNGDFCNMLVVYQATGNAYLFASDGIPTLLSANDYRRLNHLPSINGVTIIGDLTLSDIGVTQLVEEEADARRDADNDLQEQIDTIAASSDVVDIVGTYQELMQYDTSHLTINDVIKVLDDETENDATTYYRWTNDGWLFIGQEGPYYTKSQVNELLAGKLDDDALDDYYDKTETDTLLAGKADASDLAAKQDKLIAGTNITIDQATNTISATVPSLDNYYTKQETYSQTEVDNLISDVEADIPTATSQLTNDSGFLTTLPIATSQILGGIKVGSGLSITPDGTLSADAQHIDVDTALSTTSTNPVENRVITNALNNKANLSDIPTVPTNVSAFYNDAGYVTSSTIAQNYYNKTETYNQSEVDSLISGVSADIPTKTSDLTNDGATGTSTYVELNQLAPVATSGSYNDLTDKPSITPELVEMSYGESNAWAKFIAAYQAHCIVYCRASSAANPASGSQTRKAFMAYVNNAENPTQVEFQYYRSVSSHTNAQQGDQVFIYLLTNASGGTWSVTTRNTFSKVVAGTNMTSSYSNGTITLNATQPTVPTKTSDLTNDGSDGGSPYVTETDIAPAELGGEGNAIHIEGTTGCSAIDTQIDGNTEQDGTPAPSAPVPVETVTGRQTITVAGKNLFNPTATPWGSKVAYNSSGTQVWWDGYCGIIEYQPVQPNTQYTFSNSAGKPILYGLVFYDANKTMLSTVPSATTTFTTPANCAYIRFAIQNDSAPTWTQLELGNQASAYEAYEAQKYEINLTGKNMLDVSVGYRYGYIQSNGQYADNNIIVLFNGFIPVEPNTTYTFSSNHANWNMTAVLYADMNTFIDRNLKSGVAANTFTTPSNCHFVRLQVNYDNQAMTDEIVAGLELQFEKGGSATAYEAYHSIKLCKIGNHQDRIYKQNGKWYLHKEISCELYDGTESGWRSDAGRIEYYDSSIMLGSSSDNAVVCDHYTTAWGVGTCIFLSGTRRAVCILDPNNFAQNLDMFKTWIASNNLTIAYALATPTTTEITNPETLKGLAELDDAYGYEPITNVMISTPNTVPALLSVSTYAGGAIPAATNNRPGVVMIGDGLSVDECGKISVRQPMSFTMQYEAGTHGEPLPGWRDDGLSEPVVGPGVSPKIYKTSLVYEPGYSLASVSFINDKTGEQISSGDLYTILLGGADVVLNNVPLGSLWGDGWADASAHVDGLHLNRFSNIYKTNDTLTPIVGFGGSSAVFALFPGSGTPIQTELSFIITKLEDMTGFIRTQGISIGLL